jgi:glutamine synthetase
MLQASLSSVPVRTFDRPQNPDGTFKRVPDYFGTNVFDAKAMGKRMSASDVETISKVMKFGGKIDSGLAERVASAAREWAVEKGATHYCHWFQPQTGATAEKHDAFLWFDKSGQPIERFTGNELLQSEPDASSFPSGGLRATFEARGYTGWDPSSPIFLMETDNGKTLYIPSVFISYHGTALDFKTPLLRSNEVLSTAATELLKLLGEANVNAVTTTVGAEQEFFLVDKHLALSRPDLKLTGRTVLGNKPAKGQELEDHYFANIPSRVNAFFNELETECYKLGVPLKTRHNEVAPAQFEVAPIFEGSNIASDHNQLLMKLLKTISAKHGFMVLLHEKPFAGVNGSGKHVNWSMSDSTGRNLIDPGNTPEQNLVFLTFLSSVLQGINDNADVLRASIASCGNDHRLGANEAPPAIISVFLGNTLDKILNHLESGNTGSVSPEKILLDLGVSHLQNVAKDNTDRNRTSPFAFTGNKFEFRAVGSSAPISYPTAILNAAVTNGIQKVISKLKPKAKNGVVSKVDILSVLKETISATKKIRFEGNGYSEEWKQEAEQRGLSNFHNTPKALAIYKETAKVKFLCDLEIFNQEDIESRLAIQQERYIKQRLIEMNCQIEMIQTAILPAGLSYLSELVTLLKEASSQGLSSRGFLNKMTENLGSACARIDSSLDTLKTQLDKATTSESLDHHNLDKTCFFIADTLLPKSEELRTAADLLETLLPNKIWPFPKYADLIFGIE